MKTRNKAGKEVWEKGREEGMKEGSIKMAKIIKAEGESITKITKYTGLSEEKIKELKINRCHYKS